MLLQIHSGKGQVLLFSTLNFNCSLKFLSCSSSNPPDSQHMTNIRSFLTYSTWQIPAYRSRKWMSGDLHEDDESKPSNRNVTLHCQKRGVPHLTRALTVERTTLESRKRGVTRMWKRDKEAKATAGDRSASSEMWTWTTNVYGVRGWK